MKRYILFFLVIATTSLLGNSDYGVAILFEKPSGLNEFEQQFVEGFIHHYKDNRSHYTEYYLWDGKESLTPLDSSIVTQNSLDEKPITLAVVVKFDFSPLYPRVIEVPQIEVVDLVTSEVLLRHKYPSNLYNINSECFGWPVEEGRTLSKAEKLENEVAIKKCYLQNAKSDGKVFAGIADLVRTKLDKPWEVVDYELNEKNLLATLRFSATSKSKLSKQESLHLYAKSNYEGIDLFIYYGSLYLVSSNSDYSVAEPGGLSRKYMTEVLDQELVVVRDKELMYDLNNPNVVKFNFLIKGEDKKRIFPFSEILFRNPNIRVMNRNFEYPLKYFTSKYSDEDFIDHKIGSIQNKRIGAEYIIEEQTHAIHITEVESGKIVSIDTGSGENFGLGSYVTPTVLRACAEATNTNLKIEKILDEKGGKINKFIGCHPFGFDQIRFFDIMIRSYENVAGRKLAHDEMIGRCHWVKKVSDEIAVFKVSKGGKALNDALVSDKELVFKISSDRIHEIIDK